MWKYAFKGLPNSKSTQIIKNSMRIPDQWKKTPTFFIIGFQQLKRSALS
jgi:hypothetical protein